MFFKIHDSKIFKEQLKLLYRHTPFMLATTSVVGSIVVFSLWGQAEQTQLLVWLFAIYLVTIIRFIHWFWFWKETDNNNQFVVQAYILTVFSALSGFIWGAAGLYFLNTDNVVASLLICMTLPAMVAGSTASLSVLLSAYYAFAIPILTLIAFRLFSFDERVFTAAGILAVLFLIANLIFARTINRSIIDSIKLRFENIELIDKFKKEKQGADESRKKAEQANIAKSKFLAAASHDLRQPLHALMLNATVLSERRNEKDAPVVNNIIKSVDSLESLFSSLLDISKLDAGVVVPANVHFSLKKLLVSLLVDCKAYAEEKDLILDFPEIELCLYSDPVLVGRILRNLISNSIRYTASGHISFLIDEGLENICLKVIDTGIGIEEGKSEVIFEEFV